MPYYPATNRTKLVGLFYENGFQDCADFVIEDSSNPSCSDIFNYHGDKNQTVEVPGADLLREGQYDALDKLAEDNPAALKTVLAFAYVQNNHLLLTPMAAGKPERLEDVLDLVEKTFGQEAAPFLNKALDSLLDSKKVQKGLSENKDSYLDGMRRVTDRCDRLMVGSEVTSSPSVNAQPEKKGPSLPPGPFC